MKRVVVAALCALALVACVGLAACGKNLAKSPYVGSWFATTGQYAGYALDRESVHDLLGEMRVELGKDGKATAVLKGRELSGTWDETEQGFVVQAEQELQFTALEQGAASLVYDDVELRFEQL